MKRKIIIGLAVFSLIFIVSGLYAVVSIEKATAKLDTLIRLHQIELLREQLLIEIKRSQSDLYLKDTKFARSIDTVVAHVRGMDKIIPACSQCHHAAAPAGRILTLHAQIEDYKVALSRVFTIRANTERRRMEEETAFVSGMNLIATVDNITALTNSKLQKTTQAAFREIAQTKKILYIVLACIPLLAIGLAVVFIRGFTRPLAEILHATRRLKLGQLNYRISELRDEFGEVAASFNAMAASLKEDCLSMQWAEQLIVLGEMAGGLAHEIKNPLAGIKASMEFVSEDPTLTPQSRTLLRKGVEQILKIEVLLKSLLNFARPPKPHFVLTDVNSVIDATVSLVERHPAFSSRNGNSIAIAKDFDPRLPDIMADPLQLQQIFVNLLLNSADAMPEGGAITLYTSHGAGEPHIRIKIADTGPGIDAETIDKIFLPFFTTKAQGTGLGLAITKGLIGQHGGSIDVFNEPHRGASFTIRLPIEQAEEVAHHEGSDTHLPGRR